MGDFLMTSFNPMTEPQAESCVFSIVWSIDNISCSPLRPGEMMVSPTFTIEALGATEWNLSLFPRGVAVGSKHMALYLHRRHGRSDLGDIAVRFTLTLDCFDAQLAQSRSIPCARFKEDGYWGFPNFVLIGVTRYISSTSLTKAFSIRCAISIAEVDVHALTGTRLDLVTLSEDMTLLYETEQMWDVVLKTGDVELFAHRAVLMARSPKFFCRLKFDKLYRVADVSFMSGHVLEMLVFYLYSGELKVPVSETPHELLTVAQQFDLPDLARKLQTFPDVCSARSIMNVERKSVVWDIKSRLESDSSFLRILPTPTMYFENIVVLCKGVCESHTNQVQRIEASFRLAGTKKDRPVFVRCKILASEDDGAFLDVFDGDHIFDSNEEWRVSAPIDTSSFLRSPDVTSACFEFDINDGKIYSQMENDWTAISESPSLYHDGTQLSLDLKQLRIDRTFSDLLIDSDRSVFHAHKAILAARSPVFEKMFRHDVIENKRGVITVPDVRSEVIDLMLSYIYSGRVRNLTYETAGELYEAADKYEILALRDKCSSFLLEVMDEGNADGILELADMHSDFDFKEKVTEFIEQCEKSKIPMGLQVVPKLHCTI